MKSMSLSARRELLQSIRQKYRNAGRKEKQKIIDEFVAVTDYDQKYAVSLLHCRTGVPEEAAKHPTSQKYDGQVLQALIFAWHTANQICSKRLVPFCLR